MFKQSVATAAALILVTLAGCTTDQTVVSACEVYEFGADATNPVVSIQTEFGCIYAEMFVDKVPMTAGNFVALVEEGTLEGSPIHRVIPDFMMQGGDHTQGNGRGGQAHPDFDEDGDGNIPDEFHPDLRHDKPGMFSMANAGPNTGSSQFFITFKATPWLDNKHAVFGHVVDGMDVVQTIDAEAGNGAPGSNGVPPLKPVTFEAGQVFWPTA